MKQTHFIVRTMKEAELLAQQLAQWCPNPSKALIGLSELLFNAVEHGNLGISYKEKSLLNETGQWDEEIDRRLNLPENSHKTVTVQMWQMTNEIYFLIQDQGDGFDWQPFMHIDPARQLHSHGRGIAWANTVSFSHLEYLGTGNAVIAVVSRP